ncbi:hypothetical protein [Streptomyces sp. bgisy034]|uniref:hypothetical protein n=1 Tax=Streptomyces sp. bgisy034 TaxID=3413774 RepID=UPI003EBEF8DB
MQARAGLSAGAGAHLATADHVGCLAGAPERRSAGGRRASPSPCSYARAPSCAARCSC